MEGLLGLGWLRRVVTPLIHRDTVGTVPGVCREGEDTSGWAGAEVLPCGAMGHGVRAVPGEERGDISAWPLFLLTARHHSSGSRTCWHLSSTISCSERAHNAPFPSCLRSPSEALGDYHAGAVPPPLTGVKHVVTGRVVQLRASGSFTVTFLRARRSHWHTGHQRLLPASVFSGFMPMGHSQAPCSTLLPSFGTDISHGHLELLGAGALVPLLC